MIAAAPRPPLLAPARYFVSPLFDIVTIGGGLSLAFGLAMWFANIHVTLGPWLAILFIFSNNAHFAASSVRLYTRPGVTRSQPWLTLAFPLVALAAATLAIALPEPLGLYLFTLYAVWSPYHYSQQAYGLAVMYGYRAEVALDDRAKRVVRAACLVPFAWALLQPSGGVGGVLRYWHAPAPAPFELFRSGASGGLAVLTLLAPLAMLLWLRARHGVALPFISVLTVVSNAVWWTLFNFLDAFLWATVFHGLQYLAIVTIFHAKDRTRSAGVRWVGWHAASFYAACLAIGYVLFNLWPYAYGAAGYNLGKATLVTVAAINIHHFVVDAYIWRLRRDPNYANVVETREPVPA